MTQSPVPVGTSPGPMMQHSPMQQMPVGPPQGMVGPGGPVVQGPGSGMVGAGGQQGFPQMGVGPNQGPY